MVMPSAHRTVVIARPVEEVFAFFADCEANDPLWRDHVKDIRGEGTAGVGMRYYQRVAGPGGRAIPADFEITIYEPNERLFFDVVAGPVRPHGEFLFTSQGDATQVSFSLAAELTGLKKLLMSKPVESAMKAEVAGLDKAKAILDEGPSGTASR